MKKKILSAVLAITTVMGMSISSFAAINDTTSAAEGEEITATSTTQTPVISVTVPTNLAVVVNPYGISVDFDTDGDDETDPVACTDKILAPVLTISSASNVPIAVNVDSFVAKPKSENSTITIANKTATSATTKTAYIYLKIGTDLSSADAKTVIASTAGTKAAAVYTFPACAKEDDAYTPVDVKFQLGGDVNANPTKQVTQQVDGKNVKVTVADPWTDTDADKIDVSIKFTFTPQIVPQTPANP